MTTQHLLWSGFGDRVKRRREELGLSQPQLARRIDVSDKTISRWETGQDAPTPERLDRLAKALHANPIELAFSVELEQVEPPAALREFLDSPPGRNVTPQERAVLASVRWGSIEPTPGLFASWAMLLRGYIEQSEVAEVARDFDEEYRAQKKKPTK